MAEAAPEFESLVEVSLEGRASGLDFARQHLAKNKIEMACSCYAAASTDMFVLGLNRWRLEADDPGEDFRAAIEDALELAKYHEQVTNPYESSPNVIVLRQAMYAQLLMGKPIDAEFRRLTAVPAAERAEPQEFEPDWFLVLDDLVFELAEHCAVPAEWRDFSNWLKPRKRTANMVHTLAAYADVVASTHADDAKGLADAVKRAQTCYLRRGRVTISWGGPPIKHLLVDFRLGAILKSCANAHAALFEDVDSTHLWRWD